MRFSRSAALLLATCALGLSACGGSDDEESSAITTLPTAPASPTDTTATTVTSETTTDGRDATTPEAPTSTNGESPAGTSDSGATDADDEVTSGGVAPSTGSTDGRNNAGGQQPTITAGTAEEPASAIADDPSMIDLWCEQARQGAYDEQVGDATTLAITVRGSDDTRTCELPR